jgi:hypothetical protein
MSSKEDNIKKKKNTTTEKPRPKQKAPMPKGVEFEKGNLAAFKYKEEYAVWMDLYVSDGYMVIPTLEEFCEVSKLPLRSVARWVAEAKEDEEKYPRLASSYARLLNKQKMLLIQMGLQEQFNVQMVKFLLANNHGMSEKTSAQVDAKTDNKFEVNIKVID